MNPMASTSSALTVEEYNVEWKRLHDAYFRDRDARTAQLLRDREELRRRLNGHGDRIG